MASPQGTERYKRLQEHFQVLSTRAAKGKSLLPDTGYADFLKDLDLVSLPNAVQKITPKPPRIKHKGMMGGMTGGGNVKLAPIVPPATIMKRAKASQDQSLQRLKAVESHLWRQRQEERELRAAELNQKRQNSQAQRSAQQYSKAINKKQLEAAGQYRDKELAMSRSFQRELHQMNDESRQRLQAAQGARSRQNEATISAMRKDQELAWRYRGLMDALDQKKREREMLGSEYLSKLRAKESEEQHLKKELHDVSLTMKMEAQKTNKTMEEIEKQKMADIKAGIKTALSHEETQRSERKTKAMLGQKFEANKWSLQKDLSVNQEKNTGKLRKGGKSLNTVRTRLQENEHMKRLLAREVDEIEREMIGAQLNTKSQVVDSKKRENVEAVRRNAMESNLKEYNEWEKRYFRNINESMAREHGDRYNELKQRVDEYERFDISLSSQAKGAEADKRKHQKQLSEMQDELSALKRQNARKIQDALTQANRAETELEHKIQRKDAELRKSTNVEELSLQQLTVHKLKTKEERKKLEDEKREQQRRVRIQRKGTL